MRKSISRRTSLPSNPRISPVAAKTRKTKKVSFFLKKSHLPHFFPGVSVSQDHNAAGKTVLRDNKILDPRAKNMSLYNKKSSPGFGNSKLTKRKMKVMETEKLFKKYGPHSIFLYKPGVALPDLSEYLNNIIEVRKNGGFLIFLTF